MTDNNLLNFSKLDITFLHGELFKDSCYIIEQSKASAYRSVNEALVKRNWLLGLRIQQETLKDQRAEYGEQAVAKLAKELTDKYGKGFTKTNLYNYISFFQAWPNIFHSENGKYDIPHLHANERGTTPRNRATKRVFQIAE